MTEKTTAALGDVKVLDLTEDRGLYAGKLLADLGADVILIEKPEGSRARRIGPFKNDLAGFENSLYFLHFNTNKRGITLNLDNPTGRDIFRQLVKGTDIVIEDGEVGYLKSLGLDYPALKELNRGLILASLTGFGQTGPYRDYKSSDMVSFAMGGMMYINGPEDAAPVVAPCQQSHYSVSAAAFFDILAALFLRLRTGEGQWIDASAQEVLSNFASGNGGIMNYSHMAQITRRNGSQFGAVPGRVFPCQDGYVHILIIRPNHWIGLLEVMGKPEALIGEKWYDSSFRNENVDIIDAHVVEYTMAHNKQEIAELCQVKGVPCTPVNSPVDLYHDPHLRHRSFFQSAEHPVIGQYTTLSPVNRLSSTPCVIRRPAPLLGQHNPEVYGGLGYIAEELKELKNEGVL
jgi:crotonobetainyl-CoA:carnitine CoA-transferase CaiB-like acyl-CoA transferase